MVNTLAAENETEQVIELMLQVSPPWLPSILNKVTRQLFGRWFLSNHFGSRAKYFGNLIFHVVFPFFCNNSGWYEIKKPKKNYKIYIAMKRMKLPNV